MAGSAGRRCSSLTGASLRRIMAELNPRPEASGRGEKIGNQICSVIPTSPDQLGLEFLANSLVVRGSRYVCN